MRNFGAIGLFLLSMGGLLVTAVAVETTIKGGRMEYLHQGDEVLFTGRVRLDHGTDVLKADEMRTNKTRDKVTAKGKVELFRDVCATETWRGFGDSGFYNTQSGEGYLLGGREQAHLIRTEILSSTMTRVLHLYSDRFDFNGKDHHGVATGNVKGHTVDPATNDLFDFVSPHADFDGDQKKLVLSGTPQSTIRQTVGPDHKTVTGDVIIYYIDSKRLISDGNAKAVFEDSKKKRK